MISLIGLIALILSHLAAPGGTTACLSGYQQVEPCSAPVDTTADGNTTDGSGAPFENTATKRISNGF